MKIMSKLASFRVLLISYICFSIITGLFCIVLTPPFQVADEPDHFLRVIQIADGGLVGTRRSLMESGGMLSETATLMKNAVMKGQFIVPEQIQPGLSERIRTMRWSSRKEFAIFPNIVRYPPVSYAGAVGGVLCGRVLHVNPLQTFYLARTGNLLVSVGISALALSLVPEIAVFFMTILMLPMSISLMASCSQDGAVLALTAFAVAAVLRAMRETEKKRQCILLCVGGLAFGCVVAAKIPYVFMIFVPLLFIGRQNIKYILASCIIGLSVFVAWVLLGLIPVISKLVPQRVSDSEQISYVIHHPFKVIYAFYHTIEVLWKELLHQTIGVMGWLNVYFSSYDYRVCYIVLFLGFISLFLFVRGYVTADEVLLRFLGLFLIVSGILVSIFMALYVTWTPVGQDIVEGVQGRYFLPVLTLAGLCPFIWKKYEVSENFSYTKKQSIVPGIVINSVMVAFMMFCNIIICEALSNAYW